MKSLVVIVLAAMFTTACAMGAVERETVEITASDLAALPDGEVLELDLGVDVAYTIAVSDPADQSRIVLSLNDYSISLADWIDDTEILNDGLGLVAGCEGGWQIDCDGNVCCSVCQSTGEVGQCKAVMQ